MSTQADGLYILAAMCGAIVTWVVAAAFSRLWSRKSASLSSFPAGARRIGKAGSLLAVLACGFAVAATLCRALPAAQVFDPVIGKWSLNAAKSHMSAPANTVREYEPAGDGVRVSESRTDTAGRLTTIEYVVRYDGNEYPVFSVETPGGTRVKTGGTMSLTRLDAYTAKGVARINGKVAYTFTRAVSRDSRSLTVTLIRSEPSGEHITSLLVYDRLTEMSAIH